MKIRHEYVMRQIAGETILVPVGKTPPEQNGLLALNESGAFLWDRLEQVNSERELVDALLDHYEVLPETAETDVAEFLSQLRKLNILDDAP